jgi:type II secretory pathway pseudopilin PulG
MPIPFTCPHCDEQTLADDQYAGHEGPCVNCGWTVTIPADSPRVSVGSAASGDTALVRNRVQRMLVAAGVLALLAAVVGLALLLVGPAVQAGRSAALRHRCATNLQQLALALAAYERDYGAYPPAYTVGPDGKPWHSWRVLVLPYLGTTENHLYHRYDRGQPWNAPHNVQLLSSMPSVFVSPADEAAAARNQTSYLAILGPDMVFTGSSSTASSEIGDGLDQTIVLVETRGSGIGWTEPRDLDGQAIAYRIGTDIGGNHPRGVNVATADGETHFLPDTVSPQELHAMLTRSGGEGAFVAED